jgi:hypothetical protein
LHKLLLRAFTLEQPCGAAKQYKQQRPALGRALCA